MTAVINAGSVYLTLEAKAKDFLGTMGKADKAYASTTSASNMAGLRIKTNESDISRTRGTAIMQYRRLTDEEKKRIGALEQENAELAKGQTALRGTGQEANKTGKQFNFMAVAGMGALVGLVAMSGTGSAAIDETLGLVSGAVDATLNGMFESFKRGDNIGEILFHTFADQTKYWLEVAGFDVDGFVKATTAAMGGAGQATQDAFGAAGAATNEFLAGMAVGAVDAGGQIGGAIGGAGQAAQDAWAIADADIQQRWAGMALGAQDIGGQIGGAIGGAGQAAQDAWAAHSAEVGGFMIGLGLTAAAEGQNILNGLDLPGLGQGIQDLLKGDGKELLEWADNLGDALEGAGKRAGEFWESLQKQAGSATEGAQDAWNSFWGKK